MIFILLGSKSEKRNFTQETQSVPDIQVCVLIILYL